MLTDKPFYILRHAQSEANINHITAGGEVDTPLSRLGRAQAMSLAPFMSQLDPLPAAVFTSPMQRAHDTAALVTQETQLPLSPMEDLRERRLGEWNGEPFSEILPRLESGENPKEGETDTAFQERVRVCFEKILTAELAGPPLIVTHGGVFHTLGFFYSYAMGPIQNCHLHYFEPWPENPDMPWKIWVYDIKDAQLERLPSSACPSMQDMN